MSLKNQKQNWKQLRNEDDVEAMLYHDLGQNYNLYLQVKHFAD